LTICEVCAMNADSSITQLVEIVFKIDAAKEDPAHDL